MGSAKRASGCSILRVLCEVGYLQGGLHGLAILSWIFDSISTVNSCGRGRSCNVFTCCDTCDLGKWEHSPCFCSYKSSLMAVMFYGVCLPWG